ncbi:MAG: hypothetical protein ACRDUY_03760 [Nitriliruptorales bacterium]
MAESFRDLLAASFGEAEGREPGEEPDNSEEPEAEEDTEETDPVAPDEEGGDEDEDLEEEDEAEEDEPESEEDGEPLAVTEDTVIVLNGEQTTVKDALLRHSDYTRKRQEDAAARQQAEELLTQAVEWFEERSTDPVGWITEIASGNQDPTTVVAHVLVQLGKAGKLDPEFVKTFGIDTSDSAVTRRAADGEVTERLERIERDRQDEKTQAEQERLRQEALTRYRQQYAEVLTGNELQFATPEAEAEFRRELVEFARQRGITDLRDAYDLMSVRRKRETEVAEQQAAKRQAKEATKARKAKASTAISRKGGGQAMPPPAEPGDFRAAAREALREHGLSS